MTSPRATALSDQMDAANREDKAQLLKISHETRSQMGPVLRRVWDATNRRLYRRLCASSDAGLPLMCEHVSTMAPTDAVFLVTWAPDMLRCGECAAASADDTVRPADSRVCAGCGRVVVALVSAVVSIPGLVEETPDGRLIGSPPRFFIAAICHDCYRQEMT